MNRLRTLFLTTAICAVSLFQLVPAGLAQAPAGAPAAGAAPQVLSLEDCLRMAMENNRRRPASRFAVAMAEAQHRQALAGYWPQITAKAGITRMDEAANFVFPSASFGIPAQTINIPGGTTMVSLPANAFGLGFPPSAIQVPINFPDQSIRTAAQSFPLPEQNIKVLDPQTYASAGDLTWLLYDGGMRKGYREQALGAVKAAQAGVRRTDLELTDSVVRLYYGAVLARQLRKVGEDTLTRMDVTLELTESMYKNGAGKVMKTDYLDSQVMVETLRSAVAMLAKNEAAAEAALAYTMGLSWTATVRPSAEEVPYKPFTAKMEELVATAYEFSPDWAQVEAGLRAYEGAVKTEKSAYYPKVAFTGQLRRWWNSYSQGAATVENKAGWTIGIGAEIPIFNGFLTSSKVAEALARVSKLKEEKFLLREGIGLQIRDLFLSLDAVSKSFDASGRAMKAASENRDLTTRAYQSELVETDKVIRAQLFEALMSAQHLKTRYEHLALESQVSVVVGKEMVAKLNPTP